MMPALPAAARKEFERAVSLFNEGRFATADDICAGLLARFPDDAELSRFGGVLANRMGRYEVAVQRLDRSLRSQPRSPRALAALAYAHEQLGHLEEACATFSAAIQAEPAFADAHNGLGMTLRRMGRSGEALQCFERAMSLDPRGAEPRVNAARLLLDFGRAPEAAARYREALALARGRADIARNCAVGLQEAGEAESAVAAYREILERDPDDLVSRSQLALALESLGREVEAMREVEAAIARGTPHAMVRNAYGLLLLNRGRPAEAVREFERALAIDPSSTDSRFNLALALRLDGRRDEALARMREAESRLDAAGLARLARLYGQVGESAAGIEAAERAVGLDGMMQQAHTALFTERMRMGQMERAWPEYLYRPTRGTAILAEVAQGRYPPPLPSPLAGATVIIGWEQGMGDMLFFLRYAKPLVDAGARLAMLNVQPRLESLVRRSLAIEIWPETRKPQAGETFVWAGDLPLFVRPLIGADVCSPLPLSPLRDRVTRMQARLGPSDLRTIGIAWQAGTPPGNGPIEQKLLFKQIDPRMLGETLAGLPFRWVSIQRNPSQASMSDIEDALGVSMTDLGEVNVDLEDTLALLSLLDGYVGVSSTNVHLLAALGRSGRILVPFPPEWRWQGSGRSPHFRDFETYRQDRDRDWAPALARLRVDLAAEKEAT